ncbi:MAG TPA: DMT family transporter, partial [Thermoanaerobaculia bacterium]|nr:DMT family transporter [Thermoanaerobaculia bacterium]
MNARQIAALLFLSAVWGASFLFIRIAAPVLGPFPLMAGRVILAAGALWLYAAARRSPIVFAPYGKRLLVLGLIHSAIPFSLIAAAEIHLTASMAAVLLAAQPLFAALIGSFWLGEPISARRLTGLGLGIVGVAVLMGWSPLSLDATSVASVVAVLAAS